MKHIELMTPRLRATCLSLVTASCCLVSGVPGCSSSSTSLPAQADGSADNDSSVTTESGTETSTADDANGSTDATMPESDGSSPEDAAETSTDSGSHEGGPVGPGDGGDAATPSCTSALVISAAYGDGGFAGSDASPPGLWASDYVEIHNRGTTAQSLDGLSVQYASAGSTTKASGVVTLSNVSVPAGGYYLLALTCAASDAGSGCGPGGSALPTPDQSSPTINMSFQNGKVFLVQGTTAITFDSTGAPAAGSVVLDAFGYGTANYAEGTKAPAGETNPFVRKNSGCQDTNDNAADFDDSTAVTPRNAATAAVTCAVCGGTQ